ncbi:MAG: hypothetical protein Q8K51_13590, partial [Nitrospirota bacterium]|nr:hypothetical protein [Nitrospirota bacterium]
ADLNLNETFMPQRDTKDYKNSPHPTPLPQGARERINSPSLDGQWLVEEGVRGRVEEVFTDEKQRYKKGISGLFFLQRT